MIIPTIPTIPQNFKRCVLFSEILRFKNSGKVGFFGIFKIFRLQNHNIKYSFLSKREV